MDYEIKILLNNLIDAVNNTNHTDWWMFGVSLINIIATCFLSILLWRTTQKIGAQQNKLQKQQNKLNKFEIYKDLYITIYNIGEFSISFLTHVNTIIKNIDNEIAEYYLKKIDSDAKLLHSQIKENKISFILKPNNKIDFSDFDALFDSINAIIHLCNAIRNGSLTLSTSYEQVTGEMSRSDRLDIDDLLKYVENNHINIGPLVFQMSFFGVYTYKIFEQKNIIRIIEKEFSEDL